MVLVAAVALAGCGGSDPPPFRLNMRQVVANRIAPEHQLAVADILAAMFGTPDEPYVLPETGLDERLLRMAAGPVWSDKLTGRHGLYRRHCAHCHGISGDGMGPTAMILNPYPRDYRPGVFKFKSTFTTAKPTEDDLRRTLHNGVPGTAMPSFFLLPQDEVEALIEYVKYLSMRGQMETELVNYVGLELDPGDPFDPSTDSDLREMIVSEFLADIVLSWKEAAEKVIVPNTEAIPPDNRSPEEVAVSAAKGRELFFSAAKGNCFLCHGPTGLGDGQQTDYDIWSDAVVKFIEKTDGLPAAIQAEKKYVAELKNEGEIAATYERIERTDEELAERLAVMKRLLPPRHAIPRNLREGMYRGGGRPYDLFCRITAGIAGTPMPAAGAATPGSPSTLSEEEIWQIVDYIHSLPFEPASRPAATRVNYGEIVK